MAAQTQAEDFSEGETYDFTRCVRADGSHYGTSGTCRKGSVAEAAVKAAPKAKASAGAAVKEKRKAKLKDTAPNPPAAKPAKKAATQFKGPMDYESKLKSHLKSNPELKKHMENWKNSKASAKNEASLAKDARKEAKAATDKNVKAGILARSNEHLGYADKHERAAAKHYDRAGVAARKATREFNKMNGIKKSAEERALDKQIKIMG